MDNKAFGDGSHIIYVNGECKDPETCFVAKENSEIIGAILSGNDGRRGYIYHTDVSPEHRLRVSEQHSQAPRSKHCPIWE